MTSIECNNRRIQNHHFINPKLLLTTYNIFAVKAICAAGIGLLTGFLAYVFLKYVSFLEGVFWAYGHLDGAGIKIIIIPALGGLFVGIILHFFVQQNAKGHGVAAVVNAVTFMDGKISPKITLAKSITAGIAIGSGGSVGAEGPMVQLGASIGSLVGRKFLRRSSATKTLIACGAAAGVSATFNAPLAGIFFALEIILNKFTYSNFLFVTIASLSASVIGRSFLGNIPAYGNQFYSLKTPIELGLYLILGFITGGSAVLFTKTFYLTGDIFNKLSKIPSYIKPSLGGLLVGIIGYFIPQILGTGHHPILEALHGDFLFLPFIVFGVLKIFATSFTIGSGGSGGVFAPVLFVGAMIGGAFGIAVNFAFPQITAPIGAYALVGMAGLFAGTDHAPLTAIVLLMELTDNYKMILPLMLTSVISVAFAKYLYREDLTSGLFSRLGLDLEKARSRNRINGVWVKNIMNSDVKTVPDDLPLWKVKKIFDNTSHKGIPVVNKDNQISGIITESDINSALKKGKDNLQVKDIACTNLVVAYPNDSLQEVLEKMVENNIGRIPVVDNDDFHRILGIITRTDIIMALSQLAKEE